LESDTQDAVMGVRGNIDWPAVDDRCDPVTNGILDQRLQEQRRDRELPGRRIYIYIRSKPSAESDLLDRKISRHQIDLLGQRDPLTRGEAQREAEEIRHQLRHLARIAG